MSIPLKLKVALAISGIVLAVTATLTGISILMTKRSLVETTLNDLSAIAGIAGDFFGAKITLLKADAETVAARAADASPDQLPVIFQQAQAHFPDFLAFTIFDRHGLVAAWGDQPTPADYLGRSEYLDKAFQGEQVISTTRVESEKLVIHLCVPMDRDRVLSVTISGLIFQDMLASFKRWHTGTVFLKDEYGTSIASPEPERVQTRYNIYDPKIGGNITKYDALLAKTLQTQPGGVASYTYNEYSLEAEALLAWQTLDSTTDGWVVGISAPLQDSPVAKSRQMLLWAAAIFLGVGFLASFCFSGYAARPFLLIEAQNRHLKELNDALAAAVEGKSIFLANMSHEMRTPLTAVLGLTELMLNAEGEYPMEHIESLEKVYNAGSTLLGIVNDILDISKINSGKFEIVPVEYDLPSLINDAVTQNVLRIAERPITLDLEVNPDMPSRLFGDDLRIKQILNNLISNAIKYTHQGSVSLNFTFEWGEGAEVWLIFTVKDTGIGIQPKDMEKVFLDYTQVDARANRRIEGTGLGLPLARQLAEMMGGSITVESEYGQGSAFKVRIRQGLATELPLGREVAKNLVQLRFHNSKLDRNRKLSRVYLPYARVLVVDDAPTNLDVARGLMKPYGLRVDCVESGQAAIDLIRAAQVKYNAVFMDHMMPGMDGIEATRIIREEIDSDYARAMPIIALTANAVVGSEQMFLHKGFQGFISKPIDIMQLDLAIRQWVRDKGHEVDEEAGWRPARPVWAEGEIEGLNLARGLARFGGDMETYLEIVASYLRHTPA